MDDSPAADEQGDSQGGRAGFRAAAESAFADW